jgi:hypothetical protein
LHFIPPPRCDPTRVMASSFMRFLDHTQRRTTVGRTPLDEWSARRRTIYSLSTCKRIDIHVGSAREIRSSAERVTKFLIAKRCTWQQDKKSAIFVILVVQTEIMKYKRYYQDSSWQLLGMYVTCCPVNIQGVELPHYRPGQDLRAQEACGFQIYRQLAHEGANAVSPTHRPPLPPGDTFVLFLLEAVSTPGPQYAGRIKSMRNPNNDIGNRTHDLPAWSAVPQPNAPLRVYRVYWVQSAIYRVYWVQSAIYLQNVPCVTM